MKDPRQRRAVLVWSEVTGDLDTSKQEEGLSRSQGDPSFNSTTLVLFGSGMFSFQETIDRMSWTRSRLEGVM